MFATWFQAALMSFMLAATFYKVVDYPDMEDVFNKRGPKGFSKEKRNYFSSVLGTAFLWSSNITIMAAFGSVLQIPLQVPVMTRELSNKMYHPLAYLYGRLLS